MHKVIADEQTVTGVHTAHRYIWVGGNGYDSIVPYEDYGEMAPSLWFAIYKGEKVALRIRSGPDTVVEYE